MTRMMTRWLAGWWRRRRLRRVREVRVTVGGTHDACAAPVYGLGVVQLNAWDAGRVFDGDELRLPGGARIEAASALGLTALLPPLAEGQERRAVLVRVGSECRCARCWCANEAPRGAGEGGR